MPLLTINNLQTSPLTIQDPSGLSGLSLTVPGSGSIAGKAVTLQALASIEPLLIAEKTAGNITWSVADDPASAADSPPHVVSTPTASPYNAAAGDEYILCNRGTSGAMSVAIASRRRPSRMASAM